MVAILTQPGAMESTKADHHRLLTNSAPAMDKNHHLMACLREPQSSLAVNHLTQVNLRIQVATVKATRQEGTSKDLLLVNINKALLRGSISRDRRLETGSRLNMAILVLSNLRTQDNIQASREDTVEEVMVIKLLPLYTSNFVHGGGTVTVMRV